MDKSTSFSFRAFARRLRCLFSCQGACACSSLALITRYAIPFVSSIPFVSLHNLHTIKKQERMRTYGVCVRVCVRACVRVRACVLGLSSAKRI